jgi:hypothetical protein
MDKHALSKELSKMMHDRFCDGMTEFCNKHQGMPFHVAMNGIGSAVFTVLTSIFSQADVSLVDAVLYVHEMTKNITLSMIGFYEDQGRPEKTH